VVCWDRWGCCKWVMFVGDPLAKRGSCRRRLRATLRQAQGDLPCGGTPFVVGSLRDKERSPRLGFAGGELLVLAMTIRRSFISGVGGSVLEPAYDNSTGGVVTPGRCPGYCQI